METKKTRYQLKKILGQGAMGTVYLGLDSDTDEEVAIKKLQVNSHISESESMLRFKREADIISRFSHPNIIKLKNLVERSNNMYLVMEYFAGNDLKETMQDFEPLEKVFIVKEIAETLSYIHQKEIIHRDLKPGNIMVKKNGSIQVKIIDFGLAYLNDFSGSLEKQNIVGSFAYISPEQTGLLRRSVDSRSDLYSLGATFYELMTGFPPFQENEIGKLIHKHLATKPKKPSSINPSIPPVLDAIILKLLAKEPEERYQTALGLKDDLEKFLLNPEINKSFSIGSTDKTSRLNFQIKIVGRTQELQTLKEKFSSASDGNYQSVFIRGQAGSGKSKLLNTFNEEMLAENNSFFSFKCDKAQMNIPYAPFTQILKEHLQEITKKAPKAINILKETLSSQLPLLIPVFPFLADYYPEIPPASTANTKKEDVFNAIHSYLSAIGHLQFNLIFIIDDIQWADNETLDLIASLPQSLKESKLLLLGTVREEEQNQIFMQKVQKDILIIDLKPLSKDDIPDFITKVLNSDSQFPEILIEKIFHNTLGNPFFILEMLKNLKDNNILFNQKFQWKINTQKLSDYQFETDVSKLLIKRIENFNPEELKVLSIASIIGKEFNLNLLNEILRQDSNVNAVSQLGKIITIIDKARKNQLVKEELSQGKGVYTFIHDKIIELLHTNLTPSEKSALHLHCAKTLEDLYQNNLQEHIYHIAYHYNHSNASEKMLSFNKLAYEKALTQFSLSEAYFYMSKIVEYHLGKNSLTQDLIPLVVQMAEVAQRISRISEALDILTRSLDIALRQKWEKEQKDLYLSMGTGYYYLNNLKTALEYFDKAMLLMEKNKDSLDFNEKNITQLEVTSFRLMGSSYFFASDMKKAENYLSLAVKYLDPNDWNNRIAVHGLLGWTYVFLANIEEVKKNIKVIEDNIHEIHNPIFLSQAYHVMAVCYALSGLDSEKSLQYSLKAFEYAEKIGYVVFQYSSLASRMWAFFYQHDFEKTQAAIDMALDMSAKNNILLGVYFFHAFQCETYLLQKQVKKAYTYASEHLKNIDKVSEKLAAMIFLKIQAAHEYYEDKYQDCLATLEKALNIYYKTGIILQGVPLLLFKRKLQQEMGLNTTETDLAITSLQKNAGITAYFDRFDFWFAQLSAAKAEKGTQETHSYSGSASLIKEKLQLSNIIRTSQLVSSILDTDELLRTVMDKTIEVTGAERGALLLYNNETEQMDTKISYSNDEEDKDVRVAPSIIQKIKESKKGLVITSIQEGDPTLSQTLIADNIKSIICAPLLAQDKLIGLLYMDSKLLNNLFAEEDLELLSVFTSQAAISIENALLHEKMLENARLEQEMQIAKDIQLSILPEIQDTEEYSIGSFMRTATEVGGDYYDIFMKEAPYFGVFGDVSGHGLKSGLVMMMAEVAFNAYMKNELYRNRDVRDIYQDINLTLYENIQERLCEKSSIGNQYSSMYMTFRLFRFDPAGKFEMFGNDHAEPFIVRADGSIEKLESTGFLLGIIPDAALDQPGLEFQLNSGDLLVFCSDGIEEAKNQPKEIRHKEDMVELMYGEHRIHELVSQHRNLPPQEIISKLIESVDNFMYDQEDDITMLVIRKK